MDSVIPASPCKLDIACSFGAAAGTYDDYAGLQRSVGFSLLERIPDTLAPLTVLDVGAGTGFFSAVLERRYPAAMVIGLDISEGMLQVARNRFAGCCIGGDAELLPIRTGSVDLIYSSLALQWCGSAHTAFREFFRVLKPQGHLFFSTLGPATLHELRTAWSLVDACAHVNEFITADELRQSLQQAGFSGSTIQAGPKILQYPAVMTLMRELKGLGARNLNPSRPRGLTGRKKLEKMLAVYPPVAGRRGSVPATFDIILGNGIRV